MSRTDLRPFSYVVLTLVGEGGASAHDVVQMMRRGRAYWTTSPSHYYAEPKRLSGLGYLDAKEVPGKTNARTFYTLTALGRDALADWEREPTPFPRIQSEAIVRLLGASESALPSLLAMHAELDELEAGLDEAEGIAESIPHRTRSLRLVHRYGRRMVALHREWLDEVEQELGRGTARKPGERGDRL
jgi:PadR family transcriptional regulator AphA